MYTEREELVTYIYEGHKDAYGVKGRHYNFDAMSIDELRAEADRINNAVVEAIAEEKSQEALAEARFESRIVESIQLGAESREDAIRWILQAEGLDKEYDAGYICYSLGLTYSREAEFKPFVSWDHDPRNELHW